METLAQALILLSVSCPQQHFTQLESHFSFSVCISLPLPLGLLLKSNRRRPFSSPVSLLQLLYQLRALRFKFSRSSVCLVCFGVYIKQPYRLGDIL